MTTLDARFPYKEGILSYLPLTVFMSWPLDEAMRLQASRALYLNSLSWIEQKAASEEDLLLAYLASAPQRQDLGGWAGIAEAPPISEIIKAIQLREQDGFVVGAIVRILHSLDAEQVQLDGGPSLNKVLDFLAHHGASLFNQPRSWNRKALLDLWKAYRPVAHLWAARVSTPPGAMPELQDTPTLIHPAHAVMDSEMSRYLHVLYCLAKRFQEFGLHFRAKRSKPTDPPLLELAPSNQIGDVPGWETYPHWRFNLPEAWLEHLKQYQAPKAL